MNKISDMTNPDELKELAKRVSEKIGFECVYTNKLLMMYLPVESTTRGGVILTDTEFMEGASGECVVVAIGSHAYAHEQWKGKEDIIPSVGDRVMAPAYTPSLIRTKLNYSDLGIDTDIYKDNRLKLCVCADRDVVALIKAGTPRIFTTSIR